MKISSELVSRQGASIISLGFPLDQDAFYERQNFRIQKEMYYTFAYIPSLQLFKNGHVSMEIPLEEGRGGKEFSLVAQDVCTLPRKKRGVTLTDIFYQGMFFISSGLEGPLLGNPPSRSLVDTNYKHVFTLGISKGPWYLGHEWRILLIQYWVFYSKNTQVILGGSIP